MSLYRKNIGEVQQVARVAAGVGAAVLAALYLDGPLSWAVEASGVILAGSGLVGYCPMCAVAGVRMKR